MATGTVKVWSKGRGSGWIKPDSGGDRVYVHKSGVAAQETGAAPSLESGQRVEFQIGQRPKGSAAINVRPLTDESPAADPAPDQRVTADAAS
jgi:CspA family cold shock protein